MFITARNIIGGGDSWISNADGSPDIRTLTTGVNTLTFTMPSLDYAYKPYVECPDSVDPPKFTSMSYSGTTLTVVTSSVTSAQIAGTGCKVKIRIIK